jgi:hypothetical protein
VFSIFSKETASIPPTSVQVHVVVVGRRFLLGCRFFFLLLLGCSGRRFSLQRGLNILLCIRFRLDLLVDYKMVFLNSQLISSLK